MASAKVALEKKLYSRKKCCRFYLETMPDPEMIGCISFPGDSFFNVRGRGDPTLNFSPDAKSVCGRTPSRKQYGDNAGNAKSSFAANNIS